MGRTFLSRVLGKRGELIHRSATRTLIELLEGRRLLSGDGLKAEYFHDIDLRGESITRVDASVDFDWDAASPDSRFDPDTFSVRWTGEIEPAFSETYTFYTTGDDGVRLWIDGKLLVDDWNEHSATERSGTIALEAGKSYEIKKEYFESEGVAVASLAWSSPSQPKQVVPTERLHSNVTDAAPVGSVAGLNLVHAESGQSLGLIENGEELDLSRLPVGLNVRAMISGGDVGSVRFDLDGALFRLENNWPYYLAGDSDGMPRPWTPGIGTHTLTVTPFRDADGGGEPGTAHSITFSVVAEREMAPAPEAPADLTAVDLHKLAVHLSWTDRASNESHVIVERSTDGATFLPIGSAPANVRAFTDFEVYPGTGYWYRVAAVNGGGISAYSAAVAITAPTPPPPTPNPPPPTPVEPITVSSLSLMNADTGKVITTLSEGATYDLAKLPTRNLNIRADVNGAVGSVKFHLDGKLMRTESSAPYALAGDFGTGFNPWTPALGAHTLTVVPYTLSNGGGTAAAPLTINFVVMESAPPAPPAAPINLSATASNSGKINLSWSDVSNNESGFRIERSTDGVNFTQIATVGSNVRSFGSSGLASATTYYYRVRAYNAVGPSGYTGVASATTKVASAAPTSFPNADNTGPTNRAILRPTGSMTITQDGAVVENFHMTSGILNIAAKNVTVRNFIIENPTGLAAAINIQNSSENIGAVIEDGEIFGGTATNGVAGSNYTARRLHIYNMSADCFRVRVNVTIEGCYLHDFGQHPDSHGDGVQMYPTDGGNIRILNNTIDARNANAALFQVNGAYLVEGNYFNGGNYTIQCGGETGVEFINNTFGRDSQYGPIFVGSGEEELLTWSGNVWVDTALPVSL